MGNPGQSCSVRLVKIALCLFGPLLTSVASYCNAQCPPQLNVKLLPPDTFSAFTKEVSLSGDRVVIGGGMTPQTARAAYVYAQVNDSWVQEAVLTGVTNKAFGYSVSLDHDTIVVADPGESVDSTRTGAAYVFAYSSGAWHQLVKLTADVGGGNFARTVAVFGDTIMIAAQEGTWSYGVVYVFSRNAVTQTWNLQTKLSPSDQQFPNFGLGIAGSGNAALISGADDAYVFVRSNADGPWIEQSIVKGDVPGKDFAAGRGMVAACENLLVVGCPSEVSADGLSIGAIYCYSPVEGAWTRTGKLFGGSTVSGLGRVVSVSGDFILAASNAHESIQYFAKQGDVWKMSTVTSPDHLAGSFGASIACSESSFIALDPGVPPAGAAYIFDIAQKARIVAAPSAVITCQSGTAVLSASVIGSPTLMYQWQWRPSAADQWKDVDLANFANSQNYYFAAFGSRGSALTVQFDIPEWAPPPYAVVEFRLVVANDCGTDVSSSATVTICPADFDCSGFVDTDDYDAFVHAFEDGTDNADVDGSGFVDTDDFDFFVHAFEAGC